MAVSLIEHKGKKILYIDYSQCKNQDDMIAMLKEAIVYFEKSERRLRSLSNMTDAFMGVDYMKLLKESLETTFVCKAHKEVICGVNDLRAILMKSFNSGVTGGGIKICAGKEKALDYLVS